MTLNQQDFADLEDILEKAAIEDYTEIAIRVTKHVKKKVAGLRK